MAEDWLKTQKRTPRKPEVLALAEKLGISRGDAFTMCFEFWAWCDDNLIDGNVPDGMTLKSLDAGVPGLLNGFSQALSEVGWLIVRTGPSGRTNISIPNFGRHLGQSAKLRAQNSERQRRSRDRSGGNGDLSRAERDKSVTPSLSLNGSSLEGIGGLGERGTVAQTSRAERDKNVTPDELALLAQEFCVLQSPRKDNEFEVAAEFRSMVACGNYRFAEIAAAVRGVLDKSLFWWQVRKQLDKGKANGNTVNGIRPDHRPGLTEHQQRAIAAKTRSSAAETNGHAKPPQGSP